MSFCRTNFWSFLLSYLFGVKRTSQHHGYVCWCLLGITILTSSFLFTVASNSASVIISGVISLSLVAGQLVMKSFLASSQVMTIVGGLLNSLLFIFLLTAFSNLQMMMFGRGFQSKVPEVVLCLFISCLSASLVHRVSVTTCLIFSLIALYHINRISERFHRSSVQPVVVQASKKKK